MGVWGVGVYMNDTALDLKDDCADVFSVKSVEDGTELLKQHYLLSDLDEYEAVNFWLALADWQWRKGLLIKEVQCKALELIENQTALSLWIEAGNKKSIEKRIAVLEKLKAMLLSSQPKPQKVKNSCIHYPFKEGDILALKPNEKCVGSIKRGMQWEEVPYFDAEYLKGYFQKMSMIYNKFDFRFEEGYQPILNQNSYFLLLCVKKEIVEKKSLVKGLFDEEIYFMFYDFYSEDLTNIREKVSSCDLIKTIDFSTGQFCFNTTIDYTRYELERYKKICHAPEELNKFYKIKNEVKFGAGIHFKTFLESYEIVNNPKIQIYIH